MPRRVFLPTNDKVFKKVLANEQHLSIIQGFIKDFFGYHAELSEIKILTPYNIDEYRSEPLTGEPIDSGEMLPDDEAFSILRETIHDVRVAIIDTADLIIEMQLTTQPHFVKRVMFYFAEAYTSNYARHPELGKHYDSLKPVWSINIIDFTLPTGEMDRQADGADRITEDSVLTYRLINQYNQPLRPELLRVAFFNLRKPASNPAIERWRQFFLTGQATLDAPEYLKEAARIIDYRNMTVKEREVLTAEERAQADAENIYYGAIEQGKTEGKAIGKTEGIAIGKSEGIAIGKAEQARAAARRMLQKGYRHDVIADLLEIPIAEVTAIAANE